MKNRGKLRLFTEDQRKWIEEAYREMLITDLLTVFNLEFDDNKTYSQMRSFISNHSIKSGRIATFPKGNKSWNEGTKGVMKSNITTFKKGGLPGNTRPMYSERINKDGYTEIKVPAPEKEKGAKTKFMLKHKWAWENKNGKLPKGHAIILIDGDRENCDYDNLKLVTRSELLYVNRLFKGVDGKLKETAFNVAKLVDKCREAKMDSK